MKLRALTQTNKKEQIPYTHKSNLVFISFLHTVFKDKVFL